MYGALHPGAGRAASMTYAIEQVPVSEVQRARAWLALAALTSSTPSGQPLPVCLCVHWYALCADTRRFCVARAAVVAEADDPSLLTRVAAQVNRYCFYRCAYPPGAYEGDGHCSIIAIGPDDSEPAPDSAAATSASAAAASMAANQTDSVRLRVVVVLAVDSYV